MCTLHSAALGNNSLLKKGRDENQDLSKPATCISGYFSNSGDAYSSGPYQPHIPSFRMVDVLASVRGDDRSRLGVREITSSAPSVSKLSFG